MAFGPVPCMNCGRLSFGLDFLGSAALESAPHSASNAGSGSSIGPVNAAVTLLPAPDLLRLRPDYRDYSPGVAGHQFQLRVVFADAAVQVGQMRQQIA